MQKFLFLLSLFLLFTIGFYSSTVFAEQTSEKPTWQEMSEKICGDQLCSVVQSSNETFASTSFAYFPPPLKQISQGIDPSHVTCTEGKELVLKQSSGFSACVNFSSVEKLISRGWAIHVLPDYKIEKNNSKIFTLGEFLTESEDVEYIDGVVGYLAKPVTDGIYPGVVMIHEWWGLNDNIKEMADKLASHGYVVLAIDLYEGNVATTSEQARKLVNSYDSERGVQNMNSATTFIAKNYFSEKIGSIGWCFGGGQSLNLALNNNDMDATVIYYGRLITDPEKLSSINWPVFGIFAELDKGISVDSVNAFESSLNELGIQNEIKIYSGVDHAFANPSGERFAPDVSQDAWEKTIDFLGVNLK